MLSLESFNTQLIVIMNDFTMAVLKHIKSSAAVQSNMKEEEQGELDHVVKLKCIEASNTIMKLIRYLMATAHQDPLNRLQLHHHTEGLNHSSGLMEEEERAEVEEVESDPAPCSPPPSQSNQPALSASVALSVGLDHHYVRSTSAVTPSSSFSATRRASRRKRSTAAAMTTMVTRRSDDGAESAAASVAVDSGHSARIWPWSRVTRHVCHICGTIFSAHLDLHRHLRTVHSTVEKPYACDYCPKVFSHKPHRDRHHRWHRGERSFQCEVCGKAYVTVSQLKVHKLTHTDKSFVCDVCGNGFYQLGHLKRHKLIHAAVRPFHCDVCGKGFTQAEGLKTHKLTHIGLKQLCPVCGKIYRNLKFHMANKHYHPSPRDQGDAHRKEKRFVCEVLGCGKMFSYQSSLSAHKKRLHAASPATGGSDMLFACSACKATFNSKTNLARHRSIHTGETPHGCSDCGKRFRLLDFLKAHQKVHLKRKTAVEGRKKSASP